MKFKVVFCLALLIAAIGMTDSEGARDTDGCTDPPPQLQASLADSMGHSWGEDSEQDHGWSHEGDGSVPNQGITFGSVEVIVVFLRAPLATIYVVPR